MRQRFGFALVAVLLAGVGVITAASAAPRDTAPLLSFDDGSHAGGQSILVRNGDQGTISAKINATHLERGHAYTYWWVVFNDPSKCAVDFECGPADLFNDPTNPALGFNTDQIDKVGISVLGGNGEIANNGGRAMFTGTLFADTGLGHEVVIGPDGLFVDGGSLLQSGSVMTAEIHIVLRDHGPALSGADLAEQLMTFAGNCTPLTSGGIGTGDHPCDEPQFAIHK